MSAKRSGCYVYAIGIDGLSISKVGVSTNPGARLCALQTANPFKLKVLASYLLDSPEDARLIEQEFHELNHDFRLMGEWFELDETYCHDFLRDQILAQFGAVS